MKKSAMHPHRYAVIFALLLAVSLSTAAFALTPEALVPVGNTIGIQLQSRGVLVVDFDACISAAKSSGIQKGDQILKVDGVDVEDAAMLRSYVAGSDGQALRLDILRKGRQIAMELTPMQTADGPKIGIFVRDRISGVGTVTFYDPQSGAFGALGHAVNSPATGELLEIRGGSASAARILSVQKGTVGTAGALRGAFDQTQCIGTITCNTHHGIFGTLLACPSSGTPLPVAHSDEITTGDATILSNVCGAETRAYTVAIRKVIPADVHCRNLLIEVTDPLLLAQTGGIVQGMSGSPIIQNGKLIGAVTHVLVDDPTTGYGIFIENMLESAA